MQTLHVKYVKEKSLLATATHCNISDIHPVTRATVFEANLCVGFTSPREHLQQNISS